MAMSFDSRYTIRLMMCEILVFRFTLLPVQLELLVKTSINPDEKTDSANSQDDNLWTRDPEVSGWGLSRGDVGLAAVPTILELGIVKSDWCREIRSRNAI